MTELDKKYLSTLDSIKERIQASEVLNTFLDTEEEEDYKALISSFEGEIHELYELVAKESPLEILALEDAILSTELEGLYLPKVLGFTVLRGRVNDNFKYFRPQERLASIVNFLAQSANFEYICRRIGQSIQIGFALSSDIWITNLLARLDSKRAKQFFADQKLNKYRDVKNRQRGYLTYKKQFKTLNFSTAEFPSNKAEFFQEAPSILDFLCYRIDHGMDNSSVIPSIMKTLSNKEFHEMSDYPNLLLLTIGYLDLPKKESETAHNLLNALRKSDTDLSQKFFSFVNDLVERDIALDQESHGRLMLAADKDISDDYLKFLKVLDELYTKGYLHNDTLESVSKYYGQHEGLSLPNSCLRNVLITKFRRALKGLTPQEYKEYFEWTKIFTSYISLADNQKFNQEIKAMSLQYIKVLIRTYTDKRAKDYQEIKKFVRNTFLDLNFMTPKQLTELFKTKRKKPVAN